MAHGRLKLQQILKGFADNVYFQPGPSKKLEYPCIVYSRDNAETTFAGNFPYRFTPRYMVTVIDRNPDSEIPSKVASLPMCVFNRYFASEGLNHDVYSLYFSGKET